MLLWEHRRALLQAAVLLTGAAALQRAWRRNQEALANERQARAELEEANRDLVAAQALSHVGSWDYNPATGAMWWSDELYRILGREPGAVQPDLQTFLDHVMAADRDRVEEQLRSLDGEMALEFEIETAGRQSPHAPCAERAQPAPRRFAPRPGHLPGHHRAQGAGGRGLPPRVARRAHGPGQPVAVPRPARARGRPPPPHGHAAGAALPRPRRLQDRQRQPRPQRGRRAADRHRLAPARRAAGLRHRGAAGRRRVRGPGRGHRRPRRGHAGRHDPRRPAPAVAGRRHDAARAHEHRHRDHRLRRPPSTCCATPTSRCTPPSGAGRTPTGSSTRGCRAA